MSVETFLNANSSEKYAPSGKCIYCLASENLTDEHIFPRALQPKGIDWFIPNASCEKCRDETHAFEGHVTGRLYGALRQRLGLKSRRPRKQTRKTLISFKTPDGERSEERDVEIDKFPDIYIGFDWPPPGILTGIRSATFIGSPVILANYEQALALLKDGESLSVEVDVTSFAQTIAKIAHCFACATLGPASFVPWLPEAIFRRNDLLPTYIGGEGVEPTVTKDHVHRIYGYFTSNTKPRPYVMVAVQLFAFERLPTYHVAVGEYLG